MSEIEITQFTVLSDTGKVRKYEQGKGGIDCSPSKNGLSPIGIMARFNDGSEGVAGGELGGSS